MFISKYKTNYRISHWHQILSQNDWISTWSLVISNVKEKLSLISVCIRIVFLVMILNYPGQDLLKVYGCQQGVHEGKIVIFNRKCNLTRYLCKSSQLMSLDYFERFITTWAHENHKYLIFLEKTFPVILKMAV